MTPSRAAVTDVTPPGTTAIADRAAIDRALATVADVIAPGTTVTPEDGGTTLRVTAPGTAPAALIRLGADAHRLRAALAAESVASTGLTIDEGGTVRIGLSRGSR
jgi:coenzyme F420-0:L-glutamate ligase/coenzyme F420-1:gamma-L-glutamate ligase